jgi:hypothetical protein
MLFSLGKRYDCRGLVGSWMLLDMDGEALAAHWKGALNIATEMSNFV